MINIKKETYSSEKLINNNAGSITYEFTREENLLQQYFRLREQIYIGAFNLQSFSHHIDEYDFQDYTRILIVREGGKVIGGSRITVHQKGVDTLLPLEDPEHHFLLKDVFPDLNLPNRTYTEVTRTVLSPEYRDGFISRKMIGLVLEESKKCGADYLFTVSPPVQTRNNRRHCQELGYKLIIQNHIPVPDTLAYEGKKMLLGSINLYDNVLPASNSKAN